MYAALTPTPCVCWTWQRIISHWVLQYRCGGRTLGSSGQARNNENHVVLHIAWYLAFVFDYMWFFDHWSTQRIRKILAELPK